MVQSFSGSKVTLILATIVVGLGLLWCCDVGLLALGVADAATCQVDPSPGYAVLEIEGLGCRGSRLGLCYALAGA